MVNEAQQQQRPAPFNHAVSHAPSAASKKVILAVVGAFMVLGMMMTGFLITKSSTPHPVTGVDAEVPAKPAVIVNTMAFAGAKGSVVWIVTEKSCSPDSSCYELLVVDPQSNTLKGKQRIGVPFSARQAPTLDEVFGTRFLKFGELAYSITNDTGLVAYDIYTGKPELTTQTLSGKIPGSPSRILKVEYNSSDTTFKITTMAGDLIHFDPFSQTFIPEKTSKRRKEEPVTTELYLSDELKHHLYRFTKRGDGFPFVSGSFIQESRLPGPDAPKTNNVRDIFGNLHVEKVSEKNYFRAQPLLRDLNGNLVVLYKTDLSETSPVILESVSREGKANWSLQDSSFLRIGKAFASEDLGCYYTFSENSIIIGLDKGERQYIAIDVTTGKILWRFNPRMYMEKQAS